MLIDEIVKSDCIVNPHELEMPIIKGWLHKSFVLRCQNVQDYLQDLLTKKEGLDIHKDFPNLAPSFDNIWFEWSMKPPDFEDGAVKHFGMILNAADRTKMPEAEVWDREFKGIDVRWACNAFLFHFTTNKDKAVYMGHYYWGVGPQGQFCDHREVLKEWPKIEVGEAVAPGVACTPSRTWTKNIPAEENKRGNVMMRLLTTPLMSLCFLHCRNIIVKKSDPPTPHQQKVWAKKGKPLFRHHTIMVSPHVIQRGSGHGTHGAHAVHICRGHFKHFTPDKPLFGKHHGTYWWPMMVRGSKEAGVVMSDYAPMPKEPQ